MKFLTTLTAIMAIYVSSLLAGCSLFERAMPGHTLSDANVFAMLDTINLNEIQAADLAKQKASSEEVRTWASRMLDDHATMLQDTQQLAQRINVQSDAPALASTARKAHVEMMDDLRQKSGSDFDRAYLTYQIKMHEEAIQFVEKTAESANDVRLRRHLNKMDPDLKSHLSAVKAIERHLVAQK